MPRARATRIRAIDAPKTFKGLSYPGPTELNEPPADFDEYIRCFFGAKGYGKTTLAASFPNSLTLMFEPRRKNLRIRQVNLQKHTADQIMEGADDVWEQVKLTTQRFIDDESIDCLNFDSVDIFYECAVHSISAAHKLSRPGEAGKGSADVWIEIRDEWSSFFDALAETRLGINFLSHVKTRESEELDGGKVDIKAPSCAPACLQYIKQACDFVFYYGAYNGKRALQLRDPTGAAWVAVGTRENFLQPNGKPVNVLAMPDLADKKSGYEVLVEAFKNKHWDIDTPKAERLGKDTPKKVFKKKPA